MAQKIHGDDFLDWLKACNIIPELTRRVVIDSSVGSAVIIYVEMFGTRKMIEVEPPPELRVNVTVVK